MEIFRDTRQIDFPIIDADAHVQEPPGLWIDRAPSRLKDRVPRVHHLEHGDFWSFEDGEPTQGVGLTACAGRDVTEFKPAGLRYAEIRRGMFEPEARLADMDADGLYAQVLYPSVTLQGARTYSDDPELQRFCVRAYNEWMRDFCADSGGRLIGQAIIPTTGADDAAAELEWACKNDLRGAVLSRMPNGDFDSTSDDDPFFALAQEASVSLAVHIGSFLRAAPLVKRPEWNTLAFLAGAGTSKAGGQAIPVTNDFIFSGIFERFPDLSLVLVESNIGWIPTLLEQTDDMFLRYRWYTGAVKTMNRMPSEIFHRNFWATFMIDTVGMDLLHRMNVDHLMWSTDYPHSGSDWPNSRATLERVFSGVRMDDVKRMLHENAKRLYRLDHIPDRLPGSGDSMVAKAPGLTPS